MKGLTSHHGIKLVSIPMNSPRGVIMGLNIKKRYIVLGLLAFEVATLPVAAHFVHKSDFKFDKTAFETPQRAIHVKLKSKPGITRYMVSANAPFTITSEEAAGKMSVKIMQNGLVNGNVFGENAQMPGPATSCVTPSSTQQNIIYAAERGTVLREGEILSKSVLVDIRYDPSLSPKLKVLTQKKSANISSAKTCGNANTSS